jgi:hypothetical protein
MNGEEVKAKFQPFYQIRHWRQIDCSSVGIDSPVSLFPYTQRRVDELERAGVPKNTIHEFR